MARTGNRIGSRARSKKVETKRNREGAVLLGLELAMGVPLEAIPHFDQI